MDVSTAEPPDNGPEPLASAKVPVELHEWGLVGHALRDQTEELRVASGPHRSRAADGLGIGNAGLGIGGIGKGGGGQGRGTGKPVIYAHLLGDAPPQTLRIGIKLFGGAVYEHWPAGTIAPANSGETLSWEAQIKPASDCTELQWPKAEGTDCGSPDDDYCELSEIANYKTDDGACIVVGDKAHDHLFYRAGAQFGKMSIAASRADDGSVTVKPVEDKGAPAWFVHIRREGNAVEATRYNLTADGIVLPAKGLAEGGEAVADPSAWLAQVLSDGGLTPDERDAFIRAWDSTLLRPLPTTPGDPLAPPGLSGSRDALLYVMTSAELEQVAKLEVEPAPAAIKRVFLGHIDLAPAAP